MSSQANPSPTPKFWQTRDGHSLGQRTAADGSYSLLVGAGVYTVTIEAFGYTTAAIGNVTVSQDASTVQDFALAAAPVGVLSGQVWATTDVSTTGEPVAGARIELVGVTPPLSTTTTANGAYTLPDAPLGVYTVRMTAPGFETLQTSAVISETTTLNFSPRLTVDYTVGDGGDACSVPYLWMDATDGVQHNLGDDASVLVSLPRSFTFYGRTYDNVYIGSNGFVSFGTGFNRWQGILPFVGPPNNAIYALGEDLNPAQGAQGKIYTKTLHDGRFAIAYHQVEHWRNGDPETFEIILNPFDNSIVVQYHTLSWPDYTSAGVENVDGSRGIQYSYANHPALTPGLAVKYTPFRGPAPTCGAVAVTVTGFAATLSGDGLLLTWDAANEDDIAGYRLYRSTPQAPGWVLLNDELVLPNGQAPLPMAGPHPLNQRDIHLPAPGRCR